MILCNPVYQIEVRATHSTHILSTGGGSENATFYSLLNILFKSATDVHCTSVLVLNNTALALPSPPAPHPINLFVIDPSSTGVVGVWDGSNTNTELTKPVMHCYTDIGKCQTDLGCQLRRSCQI